MTLAIAQIEDLSPSVVPQQRRRRWAAELGRALAYALGLSVYFFAVYGTCAAITARRATGAGAAAIEHAGFAWEARYIPFVPAMIVPYMSIDLFFFGAPFLLALRADRRGLSDHARRVLLTVAVAGVCFLLFPMTTSFARPRRIDGVFGWVFGFLYAFDRPYNLAPSLHLALWCLLWVVYSRHTRGIVRVAVRAWFLLIALSTVLTYQHHVIDVISGIGLGIFCLHVIPVTRSEEPCRRNCTVGWRYAAGAAAAVALGYGLRPWGLVLWWWPGATLVVMAAAYGGTGTGVFGKRDGTLAATTYLVLGPHLAGAWVWRWVRMRREEAAFARVAPGVWIGRRVGRREALELERLGVAAVLDLTAEASEERGVLQAAWRRRAAYLNVPILDLTTPTQRQLAEAVEFVRRHAATTGVYVHCLWGYSRCATVAAAYLLKIGAAVTVEHALDIIRAARPGIIVGAEAREAVRVCQKQGPPSPVRTVKTTGACPR
jgi:protein-tyrosine phosphatase/membrane-associated phospholipid phosphatase